MLKNLTIFRIQSGWKPDVSHMRNHVSVLNELGHRWKIIRDNSPVIDVKNQILLTMETQEKLIPASVVKKELDIRIANFVKSTGDEDLARTKKFRRDMKEAVLEGLWTQAFVTSKFTNIWLDSDLGFLCIDSTSEARIIEALKLMHKSSFPEMHRIETKYDVGATMHKLMLSDDQSELDFTVGRSCEIVDAGNKSIKYKNEPLDTEEVCNHLMNGKHVKRLELCHDNRIVFTLHDSMQISKLTLLNIEKESVDDDEEPETAEQIFDSEFFISAIEYSTLIVAIIGALGGEVEREEKDAA